MSVNDKMKAIADAIRAHTGGTDALTLDAMAEAIASIKAGGGGNGFTLETHECFFGTIVSAERTGSLSINIGVTDLQTKKVTFGLVAIPDETVKSNSNTGPGIIFHTINYNNFTYYTTWNTPRKAAFQSYVNYAPTANPSSTSSKDALLGNVQNDGTVTFSAETTYPLYGAGVPYFYFVFVEKGVDFS